MRVTLLSADDSRWSAALERLPHDVYHLPGYVALSASHDGGTPVAILAEDGDSVMLLPLLMREVPRAASVLGRSAYDATSPYGFPGPLAASHTPPTQAFAAHAVPQVIDFLRDQGMVSLFVRLHPLIPFPADPLCREGSLVGHGHTVAVDLGATGEELLAQIHKSHRRCIRMVERLDHRMVVISEPEGIGAFLEIYQETMDRVHASSYYYFPRTYFENMFDTLRDRVHLAFLEVEGEFVCTDLLTEVGGIVECHLGATRTARLAISPSIILAYYECLWAKARDNRFLHLGGGVGGEADSLFAFKAKFSSLRFPFSTWRVIVDQDSYSALVAARTGERYLNADHSAGFFPAYRRPAFSPLQEG